MSTIRLLMAVHFTLRESENTRPRALNKDTIWKYASAWLGQPNGKLYDKIKNMTLQEIVNQIFEERK